MTIPMERTYAVISAREFLRRLLDPTETPRVPRKVRTEAYWVLRHFPATYELNATADKCPEIWGSFDEGRTTKDRIASERTTSVAQRKQRVRGARPRNKRPR